MKGATDGAEGSLLMDNVNDGVFVNKVIIVDVMQDNTLHHRKQAQSKIRNQNKGFVVNNLGEFGHELISRFAANIINRYGKMSQK